jgi:coatomer subunit beta'
VNSKSGGGANEIAVGIDEGLVILRLGRNGPSYSMDPSGKLIHIKGRKGLTANLSSLTEEDVK